MSLDANMRPEVVAHTLKNVEDSWKDEAFAFISCNATGMQDCSSEPEAFSKSCATVVGAVVQGSDGDERIASEYMGKICGQSSLQGWYQQHCLGLKTALDAAMTADSYQNRNSFTAGKLCNRFWFQFVEEEKVRFVKEEAERKEAEEKAAEEKAKRDKEAAERVQKAKEEQERLEKQAKELAEKQAAAEAAQKKIEEARRIKEEAKAKAAKAGEELAKKKAEAEEFARKAQLKMEEAAEAEREHKKALDNVTTHEKIADPAHHEDQDTVVAGNKTTMDVRVENSTNLVVAKLDNVTTVEATRHGTSSNLSVPSLSPKGVEKKF